jgi:hypothetical protein
LGEPLGAFGGGPPFAPDLMPPAPGGGRDGGFGVVSQHS